MKRKADLDGCETRKRVCKDEARTKAKITLVSEEMFAQSPYAELERHMHLEVKPEALKFEAGARANVSAGRVRAKRSIVSAEANSSDASEMDVANTTEIDAERSYAVGEGCVHLEAKRGTFTFGAAATAKISAGRVQAKRSIVSAEANSSDASEMVVANTTEIDAERSYAVGEGGVHLEAKQGTFTFGAAATAKISAGRVQAKQIIVSGEANDSDASDMVVTEIDAEGKYAEGGAYVHLEAKQGTFRFGAGATAKVSAGRVRAKRSIVSAEAKGSAIVDIEGPYAEAEANMNVDITQKNLQFSAKARAKASAGQIRVTEGDVSAEANGPNASAMFVANNREAQIMVGAEIASASVSAGPVGMKVGFGVKTGARVGDDGAEVKVLGCGMSVGRTTGVSFFGNELKLSLW